MFYSPEKIKNSEVFMHCFAIKNSADWLIHMIIKRENIPTVISCFWFPKFDIQTVQELWIMVLCVWSWYCCIDNWHQIMCIQL